jgi:hypothetical protein
VCLWPAQYFDFGGDPGEDDPNDEHWFDRRNTNLDLVDQSGFLSGQQDSDEEEEEEGPAAEEPAEEAEEVEREANGEGTATSSSAGTTRARQQRLRAAAMHKRQALRSKAPSVQEPAIQRKTARSRAGPASASASARRQQRQQQARRRRRGGTSTASGSSAAKREGALAGALVRDWSKSLRSGASAAAGGGSSRKGHQAGQGNQAPRSLTIPASPKLHRSQRGRRVSRPGAFRARKRTPLSLLLWGRGVVS